MRIVRDASVWLVLFADGRSALCLENEALRCGYRVGELSEVLGYSERYVQEVFVRDVGMAPKLWLRWERMVLAGRLLDDGLGAPQVETRLGFSQGGGFRKEFRQMYGITPLEYARRVKGPTEWDALVRGDCMSRCAW